MKKIFGMDSLYSSKLYSGTSKGEPTFEFHDFDDPHGTDSLIPDVVLHKTETHRIVINAKGEIEVVSAMGEIQNLGKEIK